MEPQLSINQFGIPYTITVVVSSVGLFAIAMGDPTIAQMKYLELKEFAVTKGVKPEEANACPGKGRLFLALHNIGLTEEIASSILAKLKMTFDSVDADKSGALGAPHGAFDNNR